MNSMIRMNDFQKDPEALLQGQLRATERVFRSGYYILGPEVKKFEASFAKALGAKFAVGVANGMDAIEIGLRALGIGPGDEVITTPMTALATVLAIHRAGATAVLADIDGDSGCLSLESTQRCLSKKTKAVLLVHLYGQLRNIQAWKTFCEANQIHLLEDCAQSHLAQDSGRFAGTFGTYGAFSFYPTKNLGAIGDGGCLITQNEILAQESQVIRNYGQKNRYEHIALGMNSRLDELQAAILNERLSYLAEFTEKRRAVADQYFTTIKNSKVTLLAKPQQRDNHVYHLFVLRTAMREQLMKHLQAKGVESLVHYPINAHQQPIFTQISRDPKGLTVAESFAKECLSIPCHPHLTSAEISTVVNSINEF